MSFLSFFPLIPATTTASAAPVYHGGMIPCLGDVEPVNSLTSGFQLSSNQSYLLFILILPPLCVV